jgi:hypothetical protein
VTARQWTGSRSIYGGSTLREGWTTTILGSCTQCWLICAQGCAGLSDASYGTAELVETIEGAGAKANVKVQAAVALDGRFSKDAFIIDLDGQTVRCPVGAIVAIRKAKDGGGLAAFGVRCGSCPQRPLCTANKEGRTIRIHPQEATLQRKRAEQKSPE